MRRAKDMPKRPVGRPRKDALMEPDDGFACADTVNLQLDITDTVASEFLEKILAKAKYIVVL